MAGSGRSLTRRRPDALRVGVRADRAGEKRSTLVRSGLTPEWFQRDSGRELCLPGEMRVAVIGGGFAGVAAALYLNDCGVSTTLYEARVELGGRVLTDRSFVSGRIVEAGAELIGENHPLWATLAARFGLRLEPITQDADYEAIPPPVGPLRSRVRFAGRDLTDAEKGRLAADLVPHLKTIGREARPVSPTAPWTHPDAARLDGMSVADRLTTLLPAGSTQVRQWFEFVLGNDNVAPIADQSYLGLLAAVSAGRMGDDDDGMLGYWESTETHRCSQGNQELARQIEGALPDVRPRTTVTGIEIEPMLLPPVRVSATTQTGSGPISRHDDYDFAILAVPPSVWGSITFQPAFDASARTMQHGRAVKFLTRFGDEFWGDTKLAPTAKWDELGSVWEGTDRQPRVPDFDLTVFSGGSFVQPASAYPGKLATLYPPTTTPRGTPLATMFVDWPSQPTIRTGYAVPGVGEVGTVGRALLRPHRRRLFFAGEQSSPGFFGYMEGALQSGARAARDIVRVWARPCDRSVLV